MKNERGLLRPGVAALLLGLLGACRTAPPAEGAAARARDVRGAADGLRVEHEYHPAPTGGDGIAVSYDHPPKVYYATCWGYGFRDARHAWSSPCDRPRYRRCP
jgi:hypothetical protein